jgi:TolB-like protein/Flp pilus assembly protein TadD
VIVEEGDIHGDGVNIAARLEALAEPGGICVSAIVHDQVRGRLDCAFADLGEQNLKNIARPVRVYRVEIGPRPSRPHAGETPAVRNALPLPDKPSIAVLPFQNMSGDPEQEYFADGMVEEIITALSRIRWLFVIARKSMFTYKGQAVDVKRVGRELGVRYVLEGSVRKGGGRVRITAQLIDAESGAHLWADRFDGLIEDVFELQDQVATSVAGVIEPALLAAEIRRSTERPTDDLAAYDSYLRALPHVYSWEKDRVLHALGLLGRAIERDAHYAPALALASFCHHELEVNGLTDDREANRERGVALAKQALQLAGDDPGVLATAAFALGYFGEDIHVAMALIDRALLLDPSFARGWIMSGWARMWSGQPDIAIRRFETSLRLNPRDRKAFPPSGIGVAHFFNRRFDDAIGLLLSSVQELPHWTTPYRFLAASYAHLGRFKEARAIVNQLSAITPVVVRAHWPWRDPEHRELLESGLRLAIGDAAGPERAA